MGEELLKPGETCVRLGIASSTLRLYSSKFAEVLSESARSPGTAGGRLGHRVYTARDILVLSKGKELLAQGLTYEQVLGELRLAVPGLKPRGRAVAADESVAGDGARAAVEVVAGEALVATLRAAVASADRAVDAYRVVVESQGREVAELRERVARLELVVEEQRERGWWGRVFGG
ncbi:MAG: MerR family transcriptional regulator [Chloroflexi bacterium]|nr:MerR family transcriptional regulator [Chloroflexota bacterium]